MFTVYLSLKEKTVFQKYANPISFILKLSYTSYFKNYIFVH